MRKTRTLMGIVGAAALAVTTQVSAGDGAATAGDDLRQQEGHTKTAMAHRDPSHADEGQVGTAEAAGPCDASMSAGSASGEPATKADEKAYQEEFLRNVWSAP